MKEDGSIESKHKLTYHFDKYLTYLIQDVTKRPSAEILNFFYELGAALSGESLKGIKNNQREVKRSATDYFPDSAIPFHMIVKGWNWNRNSEKSKWNFTIEVGFPDETSPMTEEELEEINVKLMENALFDAEHQIAAPMFVKPDIRSSNGFRKLMTAFMGREPEPKKPRKKKVKDGEVSS